MSDINCIKNLRNKKSLSVNEIAKIMEINWRTAKKYADEDHLPEEKTTPKRGMMYDEGWGEIVSDWLLEDQQLKRKKRRTKKKLFETLQSMGFEGSYRTVCLFTKQWQNTMVADSESGDTSSERLHHAPGEAQLDFGVMEAVKNGKYIDIHCLVMSLPYSNAAFSVPLPAENQECFLHGMKTLFEQLGGVPRKLRIDNLSAAVVQVRRKGSETHYTNDFMQFANHYGFEPQACNANAGNEKGHVENKVGYVRYNFITPAPVIQSYEHLTAKLLEQLKNDHRRIHYQKHIPIQELLQEERPFLLALPEQSYPVFKQTVAKANQYGEITVDQVKVYIPKSHNYGQVELILYWDSYKALSPFGDVLFEDKRPYMHKKRLIPWRDILKNWLKKPRVVTYSRFAAYLPARISEHISIQSHTLRRERIRWLLGLLVNHDMVEIEERFYELVETQEVEEGHPYEVNWAIYDQLAKQPERGSSS